MNASEAKVKALLANVDMTLTSKLIAKAIDSTEKHGELPELMGTLIKHYVDLQYALDALSIAERKEDKGEPNFTFVIEPSIPMHQRFFSWIRGFV